MVSVIALAFVGLTPTDDVWVYPHSSDPGGDAYFRIWGAEGQPVSGDPADAGQFSYGYLRFDVSRFPTFLSLKAARLVLTQVENPSYPPEASAEAPLQVRALTGDFTEKTWKYENSAKVSPVLGKEAFFGTGKLKADSLVITIDLLAGKAKLAEAVKGGTLNLALVSALDPSQGERAMYKLWTRDAKDEKVRPHLELEFIE
jgi:hypothetical protein